jgi:hypothetical protein
MSQSKHKKNKKTQRLRDEAKIGGKLPGRNISEESEIEQTRIENRREAGPEDKTPSGDGGVEDNLDKPQSNDPIGESNY